MSLKHFHIFFITVSFLFLSYFAYWNMQAYQVSQDQTDLMLALVAAGSLLPLSIYAVWFFKKLRKLAQFAALTAGLSALQWALPAATWACAVCFKDPSSKMVQGAQSGVLFLAAVIYILLMAMFGVFYMWYRRSKKLPEAY